MSTIDRLQDWTKRGVISEAQSGMLSALIRKERFSLFFELNTLLYLGVVFLVGGLGWTFQTYFTRLGDAFILLTLTGLFASTVSYCFLKASAYSNSEIESPNYLFDYVLYFSCLILSVELGYIEFRFEWLRDAWQNYLLVSSGVFFVFAYRFDNRFVLGLALSSLAGWFGVTVSQKPWQMIEGAGSSETVRLSLLLYGVIVILIGTFLWRQKIKKHFLETYLHVAANAMFIAIISGVFEDHRAYLAGVVVLSLISIFLGVRFKRFAFVVYGTLFGYIGLSHEALREVNDFKAVLSYFVLTGAAVIISIALLARRFARSESE